MSTQKVADAVFEGGGVKGIGLVGAIKTLEQAGYGFRMLAGTSAGAIVASLVAAGYSASELEQILRALDYRRFKDEGTLDRLGAIGKGLSLILQKGIYEGDYFENWLGDLLGAKGVHTFGDLRAAPESSYRHRLQVIAADISSGRLLILPSGLSHYGIDPNEFSVARAVRMSMSIPLFFEPVDLAGRTIVDGGLLSNFPVWLFDRPDKSGDLQTPRWPTFGLRLIEPSRGQPAEIDSVITYIKQLVFTMLEAHDRQHVERLDFLRTIGIPTVGVRTTDFGLSPEKRDALFESGRQAAALFLEQWDHDRYVREARVSSDVVTQARIQRWRERVSRQIEQTIGAMSLEGARYPVR